MRLANSPLFKFFFFFFWLWTKLYDFLRYADCNKKKEREEKTQSNQLLLVYVRQIKKLNPDASVVKVGGR